MFQNIRHYLKSLYDRISNEKLKAGLLQALPFWVASLLTGLMAVGYTHLFSWAEMITAFIVHKSVAWLFIITPVCFVIALLLTKLAPYSGGSGIPQVMAAIELATPKYITKANKLLSLKIIVVKVISSFIMVLGGGIIGREGPTIQIAASIFRKVNAWLPQWWPKISKRNMIITGSAAGLAAAFNTPLGGIVFAVEELSKMHINLYKTALFSAVIIAGLTSQGLAGPYLYLGYPNITNPSMYIFIAVIAVGMVGGLLGSGTSRIMLNIMRWKRSFANNRKQILYAAGCGLIVASLAYWIDIRTLGSGKSIMEHSLFTGDKYLPWYIPLLKILGNIFSFTTGAAGGIFAPALAAGASIGSVTAGWLHLTEVNSNVLILSGMVAFLTGVTRSPFTAAILVLEMTDRHNVIFHLMLAAMIASLVSEVIDRHSFYDHLKVQYIHDLHHEDLIRDNVEKPAVT